MKLTYFSLSSALIIIILSPNVSLAQTGHGGGGTHAGSGSSHVSGNQSAGKSGSGRGLDGIAGSKANATAKGGAQSINPPTRGSQSAAPSVKQGQGNKGQANDQPRSNNQIRSNSNTQQKITNQPQVNNRVQSNN